MHPCCYGDRKNQHGPFTPYLACLIDAGHTAHLGRPLRLCAKTAEVAERSRAMLVRKCIVCDGGGAGSCVCASLYVKVRKSVDT